MEQSKNI